MPGGLEPTTIQHAFLPAELNLEAITLAGETAARHSPVLVVARDFDGVLNSHALARFGNFPDTVVVNTLPDTLFSYEGGMIRSVIADTLAVSAPNLTFALWELVEPFDSLATWTQADGAGTPWTTPGGTPGELLSVAFWSQSDTTATRDSLVWELPAAVMASFAERGSANLMVTLEESGRAPIGRLAFDAVIVPTVADDTTVVIRLVGEAQTFVFDPQPPRPVELARVGGITSDRTLLRLTLPNLLPGCPEGPVAGCPGLTPADVTLNRVELVLDGVPVGSGFRPLAPTRVVVRRLLRPELGERAPLGPAIATEFLPPGPFAPSGGSPVGIPITAAVASAFARGETELALAIQVEPQGSAFAYTWFEPTPRLRFVYTLPQPPRLP
jgi:hypothetical protein